MNKTMMKIALIQHGHYWFNRDEDTHGQPYSTTDMGLFIGANDEDFDSVIAKIRKNNTHVLALTNYKPDEFIAMLKNARLKKIQVPGEWTQFQFTK